MFEYIILYSEPDPENPDEPYWNSTADGQLEPRLHEVLNMYGEDGWEVCGLGDLGYGKGTDIILSRGRRGGQGD